MKVLYLGYFTLENVAIMEKSLGSLLFILKKSGVGVHMNGLD